MVGTSRTILHRELCEIDYAIDLIMVRILQICGLSKCLRSTIGVARRRFEHIGAVILGVFDQRIGAKAVHLFSRVSTDKRGEPFGFAFVSTKVRIEP